MSAGSRTPAPELLLVGGGGAMTLSVDVAVQALEQAHARGLRTHVTNTADTLAATPAVTAAAGGASAVDFGDPAATADWAAARAASGQRSAVVFGVREMAQEAVAATAHALGLPGNPHGAVRRIRTKDACRRALAAAGFLQPAVRLCADEAEARAFLASSAGPWVVKPRDGADSAGVRKVCGAGELAGALAELPDRAAPFLVEEFVEGAEYSVEGVFVEGRPRVLAVTAKEKLEPPYFVEIGHVLPAGLPEGTRREVEDTVTRALTALELSFGLFHVELWLTAGGIVLGEVHARIGGGWIHRMLPYALPGLELYGTVYDDVLRRPVELPAATRAAATRYFAPPPGRVTAVEGWEEVRAHPAVLHAELAVAPGDLISDYRSGGDRVGAVVVGAPTADEARELARRLVESVTFTVEAPGTAPAAAAPRVSVTVEQRPLTASFQISHMTIETVDIVRLRLLPADGTAAGEGEIAADIGYGQDGPAIAAEAEALASSLAPALAGPVADPVAALRAGLDKAHADGVSAPARMLVEMAYLDRAARTAGVPVWRLLDLPEPGRVRLLHTVPIGDPVPRDGRPLKIKLGGPDDEEVLRSLAGVDAPLILDANRGWDRQDWERVRPLVTALAPAVLEDPVRDPALLPEIRAALPDTAVLLDEGVATPADAEFAVRAAGGLNVKLMRFGGILPALTALTTATDQGAARMLGCFLEPPRAIAYAAQLAGLADWSDLDGHFWVSDDPAVPGYALDSSEPGIPRISYAKDGPA
ncbi:L-alanine-DL-glutamate epimerase [Streptomyces sp. WMMB 714]|uniref:ATP-grasp domain-containing protein n=1 Tax=Streptomyces sp. WMMB 714 TaxID=1286822 RepID=UPI000823D71A|nr:ATP-grasp domain-containing protein [Streptomyces sp. WMMB 714]SCK51225.1 L-alanine-DL-glutamate epimerase [Streptomyces sp. WMMB 714]